MKYKVGDKVKTTKDKDKDGNEVFCVGTIGRITDINFGGTVPYKVDVNGDYWWYSEDMLEPVGESDKSDMLSDEEIDQLLECCSAEEMRKYEKDLKEAESMSHYRPKERTDGLDIGIKRAVEDAWNTQVRMIYDRGYEDGKEDGAAKVLRDGMGAGLKDREEVAKEAYQRGFLDGKKRPETDYATGYNDAKREISLSGEYEKVYKRGYEEAKTEFYDNRYQEGLEDAWEAARKIANEDNDSVNFEVFGYTDAFAIIDEFTAKEAIEKIREYEEKQKQTDEIKIGDEIMIYDCDGNHKAVVVDRDSDGALWVLDENGANFVIEPDTDDRTAERTGRHFEEIAAVLGKLKGGE